jgi:hypothetical protein
VKIWQKMIAMTAVTLLIGGSYLLYVWHQRRNPGALGQAASQPVSMDDVAVVRALFITSYEQTAQLVNTTVWMKDGGVIPYFPMVGGRIDFAHPAGQVDPLQKLVIRKILKSPVPASVEDSMSHGSRQVFVLAEMPGKTGEFAIPIGAQQGNQEMYFCDLLFFYDDPHTIYDNWTKDAWAAVDAHQVRPGMSELQSRLSLGQKMHTEGSTEGDRTVSYERNGTAWKIRFEHNRAAKIESAPVKQ